MASSLPQLLVRWAILALGVFLATRLVPGIQCDNAATLVEVVVLLSLFNAVLKPILVVFTLPFILVTMGLGIIVINALLFLLVSHIVGASFHVAGFGSAVWGALVVSATNFLVSGIRGRRGPPPPPPPPPGSGDARNDVIDI